MMNRLRNQVVFFALLVLMVFSLVCCQSTKTDQSIGEGYILEKDIVYGTGGDVELLLDLARPDTGKGPFPALIFLFGGGFAQGNRSKFYFEIRQAAKRGYVAVAIDYRLTDEKLADGKAKYQFPAQIHDAKCAVRWLRSNARKYRIDKNHIGAIGYSSGGYLALMLGLTDSFVGFEGECGNVRVPSRVQAVVNLAGSTDFEINYRTYPIYMEPLLGGTPDEIPDIYKAASALAYVSADDPPILTLCGSWDPMLEQEELLDDRMKAVGASHTLVVVENASHSMSDLVDLYHDNQDNPVWDFLDKTLKEVE